MKRFPEMRCAAARSSPWLERALLFVGVLCLGLFGLTVAEAHLVDRYHGQLLDEVHELSPAPEPAVAERVPPVAGELVGRLEISRLGLSAIVLEGDDSRTLRRAAGRIPDTALPGEPGNVGIAAHRDTHFRALRDARQGDEVVFTTPDGVYRYEIESTRIVDPDAVEVLEPRGGEHLTLVTCYPFDYVGPAPRRFIVHARRLG